MHSNFLRVGVFALVFISSSFVLADQKIKTKSNIKNDRLAEQPAAGVNCPDTKATVDAKKTENEPVVECKSESASKSSVATQERAK